MSDQLDITKLTAEEVAQLYPVGDEDGPCCKAYSPDTPYFACTRQENHQGPHVAWGSLQPYAIWHEEGPTKLLYSLTD